MEEDFLDLSGASLTPGLSRGAVRVVLDPHLIGGILTCKVSCKGGGGGGRGGHNTV